MAPAVGPLCWSRRGCSLYALFLVSLATYVYVRSTMTITNWAGWLLLAAEVLAALRVAVYGLVGVVRAPRAYTPPHELLAEHEYDFTLRILVPCYNEGLEIIQQTVLAAAQADMPVGCTKHIYLCDDGKDPAKRSWIAKMARALPSAPGFTVASLHYVSDRPRRPNDGNGKSNNMNHALKTAIYPGLEAHEIPSNEVIAVLDADMVALPQIYTTLLPYLGQDEANAIVQSPQNWYNYDPASDVVDHSAHLKWHNAIPQLVNCWGGVVCMGSNFVLRSRALATVGWWPTWTVSEGIGLAQELARAGFRGYFVEDVLAIGEVPTGVRAKYVQYSRLIQGYLTNWLSPKHGSLWDPTKNFVEKVSANGLNRELLCGLYAPVMLALPPVALLAGFDLLGLNSGPQLVAWLLTWVVLYCCSQSILQYNTLPRTVAHQEACSAAAAGKPAFLNATVACNAGANWLSNLFGSLLYWDVILAAVPKVAQAELTGKALGFAVTPKSVLASAVRTLTRTLTGCLSNTVAAATSLVPALSRRLTLSPASFHRSRAATSSMSFRSPPSQLRLPSASQLLAMLDGPASLTSQEMDDGTKCKSSTCCGGLTTLRHSINLDPWPQHQASAFAPISDAPYIVDPRTKAYSPRASGEGAFPWSELRLHVAALVLSLAGVAAGCTCLLMAATLPPQSLVLTLWCAHNALPLALLMARTVWGDTHGLVVACRAAPPVALAVAVAGGSALLASVL